MTFTSEHEQTGRQHRPGANARDFLRQLRTEHPEADRPALVRLYLDHVRSLIEAGDDPAALDALVFDPLREWVGANIIEPPAPRARRTAAERAAAEAEKAALVAGMAAADEARVEGIVQVRLLEHELLDGRRLGNLTGAECGRLASRYGGFFEAVAERLAPRQLVRNGLSELHLQALAREHRLFPL